VPDFNNIMARADQRTLPNALGDFFGRLRMFTTDQHAFQIRQAPESILIRENDTGKRCTHSLVGSPGFRTQMMIVRFRPSLFAHLARFRKSMKWP
jgi:hypothetical protein